MPPDRLSMRYAPHTQKMQRSVTCRMNKELLGMVKQRLDAMRASFGIYQSTLNNAYLAKSSH